MQIPINIDPQKIADLLCCAFEGGSNYWYNIEGDKAPERYDFRTDESRIYPHLDYPLNDGGSLRICTLENDEINGQDSWILNLESIQKGFHIMAEKYPKHFADILNDNIDVVTGDVFLQCCLFGELIYG